MKLTRLSIKGIGGIKNLDLEFKPDMNIICGPNGIGKSTILLAASFPFIWGASMKVKKNIGAEHGLIELELEDEGKNYLRATEVVSYLPQEHANHHHHESFERRKLIKFETNRIFDYQMLTSISADRHVDDSEVSQQLNTGVNLYNIKDWFAKRVLFEKVELGYAPNILRNIALAKRCISILDAEFSFSRVDPRSYDIFVNTPTGEIWYEYLSSGFKSCMGLLLGIIKEIELRFPEKEIYAPEFDGVILIDELELHLHPEWQARITDALTTTFPSAQFIVTTHSPHVVQNAKSHQIIALVSSGNGEVCLKKLPDNDSGYSAWTVEEVLLDIMGMESTLSRKLQMQLDDFDRFVDAENFDEAKNIYDQLDAALHQNSVLRKSLKISLMSIKSREE
ncbi:MAG: AAA family ATPase [Pantoea agglomerans]